jgi:Arc/MetJ-type ribon-helix-helix transcriptional regulator
MTMQVAVKLSDALASELDRLVRDGAFDSRSQALRVGLETIIAVRRREQLNGDYRDAMARSPETSQEIAEATWLAVDAIREEPWQRWW